MPKFMLKRFENEQGYLAYYDVSKNIVGKNGHPKSINTEHGYYSNETENILNAEIESPLSEVLKYVDGIDYDAPYFIFEEDHSDIIKNYCYSLIARDPKMPESIRNDSIYFQFLPKQQQHDFAASKGIELAFEQGWLDSYVLTFVVNKTKIPFVLPVCGLYQCNLKGIDCIIMPVSSIISLVLFHEKNQDLMMDDLCMKMFLVEDALIINSLNSRAVKAQQAEGWGYVVSADYRLLCELVATNTD